MSTSKLLSIFRPGTHIDSAGNRLTFSENDVSAMAAAYNPELHKAPLVLGHPKDNSPAYGWTTALQFSEGSLQAVPDAVTAEFAQWVNEGHYRKISASFYSPGSPVNPVPGSFYLRHIGFFGGTPPAIKGLPEPQFAEGDDFITVDFEEALVPDVLTKEQQLAAQQQLADDKAALEKQRKEFAEQQANFSEQQKNLQTQTVAIEAEKLVSRKRGLSEFAESMIKEGRLLPKDKLGAVEFMSALSSETALEFGEGDTVTKTKSLDWFQGFMKGLPKAVNFGEAAPGSDRPVNFTEDARAIADAATEFQELQAKKGLTVSNADAVFHVMKGVR